MQGSSNCRPSPTAQSDSSPHLQPSPTHHPLPPNPLPPLEPLCLLYPLPPLHPMDPSSFLAMTHPDPQPSCLHPLDRCSFHIFFTLLLLFILLAFFLLCTLLFFPRKLLLFLQHIVTILLIRFFNFLFVLCNHPPLIQPLHPPPHPTNPSSSCLVTLHHPTPCILPLLHPPPLPLHLPPYSLRLHSSSPSSFLFFLLSPLHSLFRNFPFSSPSSFSPSS